MTSKEYSLVRYQTCGHSMISKSTPLPGALNHAGHINVIVYNSPSPVCFRCIKLQGWRGAYMPAPPGPKVTMIAPRLTLHNVTEECAVICYKGCSHEMIEPDKGYAQGSRIVGKGIWSRLICPPCQVLRIADWVDEVNTALRLDGNTFQLNELAEGAVLEQGRRES
jgi:hypothetical protein